MNNSYIHSRRFFQAFLILVFSVGFIQLKAQDPIFSQFYNNPIYYNPAYIGLNAGIRTRFNYRNQWTGIPQPFKTYSFSMDMAERAIPGSGGIGFIATSDKAGTASIKATNIGLGTSVRIPLYDNMAAQMGVMVSYAQKAINWDELVFTDELNARYGRIYQTQFERPASNRVSYPDFSVGGVYRFTETGLNNSNIQGTLGLAVHHVFEPNESFLGQNSPLPRKIVINGDLVIEMEQGGRPSSYRSYRSGGSSLKFNPGFQYEKQSEFSTYSIGLNILKSSIYLGAWFRNQTFNFFEAQDAIFSVGFNAPWSKDSRMKIMYSYDYIIQTNLNTAARSSHEISLVFEFDTFSLFGGGGGGGYSSGNRGGRVREMDCCPF